MTYVHLSRVALDFSGIKNKLENMKDVHVHIRHRIHYFIPLFQSTTLNKSAQLRFRDYQQTAYWIPWTGNLLVQREVL